MKNIITTAVIMVGSVLYIFSDTFFPPNLPEEEITYISKALRTIKHQTIPQLTEADIKEVDATTQNAILSKVTNDGGFRDLNGLRKELALKSATFTDMAPTYLDENDPESKNRDFMNNLSEDVLSLHQSTKKSTSDLRVELNKIANSVKATTLPSILNHHHKTQNTLAKLQNLTTTQITNHPIKKDAIIKRFTLLKESFDSVFTEALLKQKTELNIGAKVDFETNYIYLKNDIVFFRDDLKSLDFHNSKILHKSIIEHKVTIGVASWDPYSDYNTTQTNFFGPHKVSKEQLKDLIKKLPGSHLPNWSYSLDNNIPTNKSSAIDAEYWVEDITTKYIHQYKNIFNKNIKSVDFETKLTPFIEVDEEYYFEQEGNVGMELYSKPIGEFESEATLKPTPPGLSLVGNTKAGEWKKDSSGSNFWMYYSAYRIFNDLSMGHNNGPYTRSRLSAFNSSGRGRHNSNFTGSGASRSGQSGAATGRKLSLNRPPSVRGTSSPLRSMSSSSMSRGPGGRGK